jgi:ATP-dependent Clp protease ATP-binding subunit ClpA
VEDYVEHCRLHGCSWADIGTALGVTRQAAQQRFLAPHRQYDPEEFSGELRQALTHTKDLAVQRRNNYIGTEHLLWGLTTEDNSATRLLDGVGVSVDALRRTIQERLSTGASQAAERIAWTPYSRKALAIARETAAAESSPGIGCDHLLIGLARIGRGVAATVLHEAGADHTTLANGEADAHASAPMPSSPN